MRELMHHHIEFRPIIAFFSHAAVEIQHLPTNPHPRDVAACRSGRALSSRGKNALAIGLTMLTM